MALFQRTCRSCALWQQGTCLLTGQARTAEDYCSKLRAELHVCEICHRPAFDVIVVPQGDAAHVLCPNCGQSLSTCTFCGNHSCAQQVGYCDKFQFIWDEPEESENKENEC